MRLYLYISWENILLQKLAQEMTENYFAVCYFVFKGRNCYQKALGKSSDKSKNVI